MDLQKNLASTFDQQVIIMSLFLLNGMPTELYLYENSIAFTNQSITKVIHFDSDMLFQIMSKNQEIYGIKFYAPDIFHFVKQNWKEAELWESFLVKKIKQKNFHEYFKPMKKLGKGNFASVYLAQDKRRDSYVAVKAFVKQIAYKNNGKKALDNQIQILRKLDSQYIMKLYGVYQTENSIYLVTQFVQGISLQTYLKNNKGKISLQQRKIIIKALLKGLSQLQKKNILHRDLKPDNIIISKNGQTVKIVDFGLATQTDIDDYIFVRCGTPGYVAPQILKIRDNDKPVLDSISDMFSLGSIFYQMIFQRRLFDAYDHEDVLNQNRNCVINLTQDMKGTISFDEADLLQKLLATNPKKRITAIKAIQHPYMTQRPMNFSQFSSNKQKVLKPLNLKHSQKESNQAPDLRMFRSLNK